MIPAETLYPQPHTLNLNPGWSRMGEYGAEAVAAVLVPPPNLVVVALDVFPREYLNKKDLWERRAGLSGKK